MTAPVSAGEPPAQRDEHFMRMALDLAQQAEAQGEVPVGAVVVHEGQVVGQGWNQTITASDPTAHAEILALRSAGEALGNYRLRDCDLYVTLEPCLMCVGAIVHARVARLVYGAADPKVGAVASQGSSLELPGLNHRVKVTGGVMAEQCSEVLKQFFRARRG